jgi:ABC-type glycerol-3-phosphate transport system permease component
MSAKPADPAANSGLRMIAQRRDRLVMHVLLGAMALFWIFPLYGAVRDSLAIHGLENFVTLFSDPLGGVPIWRTYVNSFAIGACQAVMVLFVSTLAGYAFGKLRFAGRNLLYHMTILFLAIPGTAILVPVYYITQNLHLFDNYLGVALPEAALTIPFGVLMMRNYADNIPDELIEAAIVDQIGHFQIFRYIFVPMARPAVVNLTVLCFMWSLQDFLWPTILYDNPSMTTAAQAVATFRNALTGSPTDDARYSASLVLLAVPAVLLVVFGQRFIANGLTAGAVKD